VDFLKQAYLGHHYAEVTNRNVRQNLQNLQIDCS